MRQTEVGVKVKQEVHQIQPYVQTNLHGAGVRSDVQAESDRHSPLMSVTKSNLKSDKREYWIDAVRSFACLCVLMSHSPIPSTEGGRIVLPVYNFFAVSGASILFFMISGALVLYRQQEFLLFIKKRVSRIFFPMVLWTLISLVVECFEGKAEWGDMFGKILMIPFAPQVGTYWFIYVIFGIYLLTPLLSTWLAHTSKREVEFVLGLWGITLLFPFIGDGCVKIMINFSHGYFYYFYGYLGFAVLGYYLRKYVTWMNMDWRKKVVPLGLFMVFLIVYPTNLIPHSVLQDRMALHTVILASFHFLIIKHTHFSTKMKKFVYVFAQHSFGIYLVHILVMRSVLWPILEPIEINHVIAVPLITLMTALISFLLVWVIGKVVPYSKYIVGV
ncbi:MAG: acyltransferase [Bacteroidaceae bacterium]|nr:acyltransferase [Bacteroidaceae bacterium]